MLKNKSSIAIENAQVVLEDGIIWDGIILISDGKILKYGRRGEILPPDGAERIDAKGAYAGPGFVDIHVHGFEGGTTYFETKKAADFFLRNGSTTILATPSYCQDFDSFLKAIKSTKAAMPLSKNVKGMYMEGPYLNPKYGAFAEENPWRGDIKAEQYKVLVDEAGKDAKVWAIAPEREGIVPFLKYAREVNPDVVFAVGHSEALPKQIKALGKLRPTIQTHCMCATGQGSAPAGTRGAGPDEYCLKEEEVYAELISDSYAMHVNRDMQQLILHCKGAHKTILITDSAYYDDESPEKLSHITDLTFDKNGGLAGSKMTMSMACKNIMSSTACGIAEAFIMASTAPSRAIGMGDEIGSIEEGKKADIVLVDDKFNVQDVMLEGEMIDMG